MVQTNEKPRVEASGKLNRLISAGASVVFLASLLLYWLTLAPTVTFVDSGELILAADRLGVAHPPGFPLYVILAHLATLIPVGNVAQRVHFASALFASASAGTLTLLTGEALLTTRLLARGARRDRKGKKKAKKAEPRNGAGGVALVAAAVASGFLLAFSRTLWSYATIAEVYTLNTFLIVVVFFMVFRWRRLSVETMQSPPRVGQSRGRDPWLYAAALIFGLSLCVHHVTSALTLPALAILVYSTEGAAFFRSKRLLWAALFAAAGLSIYIYLPIAASASPLFNWGNPSNLARFWWHLTGRQYQVFLSGEGVMSGEAKEFAGLVWREFAALPMAMAFAFAGFVIAFKRDRSLLFFTMAAILANLAYTLNYKIAEDKDAYYLPVFVVLTLAAGYGAEWVIRRADRLRFDAIASVAVAAAVIAVPAIALTGNLGYNNRSRYFIARDYVENIAGTIDKGGMLLTLDWQVYSPLLYMREVEGYRTDVVGIDVNLLRRSWYFDYLKLAYPELMAEIRAEVDVFLDDLRNWEHDPDAYERDMTLNRRISERYLAMLKAMVAFHLNASSVYVTEEIAAGRDPQNAELTKELNSTYQLIPQGLAFQITRDRGFQTPAEPELVLRGLADGTIRFDEKDVVREKVLRVYTTMLANRGRYLAAYGRHPGAIKAFEQSLALDGGFGPAVAGLAESKRALEAKSK